MSGKDSVLQQVTFTCLFSLMQCTTRQLVDDYEQQRHHFMAVSQFKQLFQQLMTRTSTCMQHIVTGIIFIVCYYSTELLQVK